MRTVFSNFRDVMHLYAQRTQTEARSGNAFFYKDKIYSYGHHYLLAEFIQIKGETCIYINDRGYSSTTSKHIRYITQATRQYKQYFARDVDLNLVSYSIKSDYDKLLKAKKPELYITSIVRSFEALVAYPLFKGKKEEKFKAIRKIYKEVSKPELLERAKQAQKERDLKAKERFKIQVQKFVNHEVDSLTGGTDYLRLSLDKTCVETSQRVKVSIQEAKLLYNMILADKDIKGYRIAGYTVISINGVLKIGCHRIDINSVHEIGRQIMQ